MGSIPLHIIQKHIISDHTIRLLSKGLKDLYDDEFSCIEVNDKAVKNRLLSRIIESDKVKMIAGFPIDFEKYGVANKLTHFNADFNYKYSKPQHMHTHLLKKCTALKSLKLSRHLKQDSTESLSAFTALKSLEKLEIRFNDIENISGLSMLTNLTTLDISYNDITDISGLSTLISLIELNLSNNEYLYDVSPLVNCKALRKLSVTSDVDLECLEQIEVISIAYPFQALCTDNLKEITLLNSRKNTNILELIAQCNRLEKLSFGYMDDAHELDDMEQLSHLPLKSLDISATYFSSIPKLTFLTELRLSLQFCDADALNACTNLKKLDASGEYVSEYHDCWIEDNRFVTDGHIKYLTIAPQIEHLTISNTRVDNIEFLRKFTNLKSLDLHGCYMYNGNMGLIDISAISGLTTKNWNK